MLLLMFPGVLVGNKTLIKGSPPLIQGKGPIRTGITSILPKGFNKGTSTCLGRYACLKWKWGNDRITLDKRWGIFYWTYLHNKYS